MGALVPAYDDIADWYEHEFLPATDATDAIGVRRSLTELLGRGSGACLEVGCGAAPCSRSTRMTKRPLSALPGQVKPSRLYSPRSSFAGERRRRLSRRGAAVRGLAIQLSL